MRSAFLSLIVILSLNAVAQIPGAVDPTFHPTDLGWGFGEGFSHPPEHMLALPSGKILASGGFTGWEGVWDPAEQALLSSGGRGMVRLKADGSRDATFQGVFSNGAYVWHFAVMDNGSVVAVGNFTSYNGSSRNNIVKLTSTGQLDNSFVVGTGFNGSVRRIALQPDGKVLVIGVFTSYNGAPCGGIARLNADGTLDTGFVTGTGQTSAFDIACDGYYIYLCGNSVVYNGGTSSHLVMIDPYGNRQGWFAPTFPISAFQGVTNMSLTPAGIVCYMNNVGVQRFMYGGGADAGFAPVDLPVNSVSDLRTDALGNVYVCGSAGTVNGQAHQGVFKLTTTGTVDPGFMTSVPINHAPYRVVPRTDGGVVFTTNVANTVCGGRAKTFLVGLSSTGVLDDTFNRGTGFVLHNSSLKRSYDMVVQPDGKIIACGDFYAYDQFPVGGIVRINTNGQIDPTFDPGTALNTDAFSTIGLALAVQADGKVLMGGSYSSFNGTNINNLIRLQTNGTIDATFSIGTGFLGNVTALLVLPNGKIMVGGSMYNFNGAPCTGVVRLNANGSIDNTFVAPAIGQVSAIALQGDGKVIVGGSFTTVGGATMNRIVRLNSGGSVDGSFVIGTGFNERVQSILVRSNGAIIVGGRFSAYNEVAGSSIMRLLSTGGRDNSFMPPSLGGFRGVEDIKEQPSGRLIVSGDFLTGDHSDIVRLYPNGNLDETFAVQAGSALGINSVWCMPNGNVIACGAFRAMTSEGNTLGRNGLARLFGNESQVLVSPRVFLGGPTPDGSSLMSDALRSGGVLPISEPYSVTGHLYQAFDGPIGTTSGVLSLSGSNAIVDWVVVELRDQDNVSHVLTSRPALVQRDGDIVDLDGFSALAMNGSGANYRVAIRHRNHLGVMTANPIALSSTPATIDFTNPSTATYGTNAQNNINGTMVLWPGDGNSNGTVQYTGTNNDRDPVLVAIGGSIATNTVTNIYSPLDVNMNGTISYTGLGNDRDVILQAIGGSVASATRTQQLP